MARDRKPESGGPSQNERGQMTENQALKVGDVLEASWGYDQTNVDFYKVVKATAKTVWLKSLKQTYVSAASSLSEFVSASDEFESDEVYKRKVHFGSYGPAVRMTQYKFAYLWDSKPKFQSHTH